MAVIAIPQESVRVDVSFYDENERQKLLRYPTAPAIERLTTAPIDVPTAEFLTYYLLHRKKIGTLRLPGLLLDRPEAGRGTGDTGRVHRVWTFNSHAGNGRTSTDRDLRTSRRSRGVVS